MEFTIPRQALLKPLQMAAGAVERRQPLPILSNILMSVKGQVLSLTGTDLEVELVARIPLEQPARDGAVTLPARKIMDICRMLPDEADVTILAEDNKAQLRSGRGRYSLASLPAEEFPHLEEGPGDIEFSLTPKQMMSLLESTHFAMAHQDVRYYLNGLLLDVTDSTIRAVATDGHRLATHQIDVKIHDQAKRRIIVPRKAVMELVRLFSEESDDLGIVLGENHLRIVTTRYSFTTKLVDGQFPDYRQVLPKSEGFQAIVARERFKQMLSRVSVLFSDKYRGASLLLSPGVLKVKARNSEQDEVEEEIEIEYDGPERRIGFNISYILEYLNTIKSAFVRVTFSDPNASVLFESPEQEGGIYIVMPMRL